MEYTTNYHLPQWVETDRIMMGDFNQMCSDIDEGIAEAKEAAAAAQTAAETQFIAGTYTGNGKTMEEGGQLIQTDFPPRFVFITRGWNNPNSMPQHFYAAGLAMMEYAGEFIQLEATGFRVGHSSTHFRLNSADTTYSYLAFR